MVVTERIASRNSSRIISLGPEKISELKEKVRQLEGTMPEIVKEIVDDSKNWNPSNPHKPFPYIGDKPPLLNEAIRLAAGNLAPILIKYRLLSQDAWRRCDTQDKPIPGSKYRAFMEIDWTDEMKSLCSEYNSLVRECQSLSNKIENLEDEKITSEAEELWKSN